MSGLEKNVGFIGLGNMGHFFAENLSKAGYALHIVDVREDVVRDWQTKGATAWPNAQALASAVDTIFLSLPTPPIVEEVVLGKQGACHGSKVRYIIDLSTTGPEVTRKLAAALKKQDITLIDAPVSGGVAGAKAATVAIMLACSDEERVVVTPMLQALGRIHYVGHEAGMGQVIKLLNNLMSAGSLLLAGEVAAMGAKAGLDPTVMIDVFNAGSGRSSATLDKYPKAILPGTFQLGFANRLMYKDVKLCLQLADAMGLTMPISQLIGQEWAAAMAETGADADFSTIVKKAERLAGVEVRATKTS